MSSARDLGEEPPKINIYAVAKRAGVSIATVSRALSNDSRVTRSTRERVEAAAAELGWEPPHARTQSSSATQTLALVFPDIVGPFYVEVVRAVERAAHEAGYHITIYGTSVRGAHQLLSSFEFVSKIDGMIVMTTALTDDEIRRLHSRGLPMVLLGRSAPVPSLDVIQTTNFDGAHMATVHLIRHGHRRIAFIAGPPDSPDASDRAAGYREALSEHQIHFDPALFVRGDFRQPSGSRAVATLLESSETPSAVFAANDEMATGAVQALRERGFNVPADVAVIGFDDIPLAAHMLPTLTTVRQPLQEFGRIAVQRLAAQISRETSSAETVVLPAALVLRQSCGCEPKDSSKEVTEEQSKRFERRG